MTVADGLLRHARRTPERVALVVDGRPCSYGALAGRVEAAADALRGVAGGRGGRVGILMQPGPPFFEAFLGAGLAGMAGMVLQTGWSPRELRQALETGRPAVVLAGAGLADRLAEQAVVVGPRGVAAALGGAGSAGPRCPAEPPGDDSPFYVGFTSGTTGRPRGFVRSHRSWIRSFEAADAAFGIGAGEHVHAPGPLDHSLFLFAAVHGFWAGAQVHLQRRFAPRALLRALAQDGPHRLYVVPTMLLALLRAADRESAPPRLDQVASVICSGAGWPATARERVAELFPDADVVDFYGASELSFVSVRRPAPDDPPGSIGRPLPGVEVRIRRPDGGEAAPDETGRMWVRSEMLFSGYLEADSGGAERSADGWVSVGDMASRAPDGSLRLAGRETSMLVSGGLNVFCEEVEAALSELPEVAEAAVVGLEDGYWGQAICAVVRWADGQRLARARLREHCRDRLARGKQPQRWLEADDFPRTPSGKLARTALTRGVREGTWTVRELA